MSETDFTSSLPIQTAADADSKVQVKIMDYADPSGVGKQAEVSDGNVHAYVHGKDIGGTERLLKLSEQGSAHVDGVYDATGNTDPANVGLIAHARGASPADSDQTQRLTAVTSGSVHALDVSLHDHTGAAFGPANPLYVNVTNGTAGTEVLEYHEYADVAAGGTANWSYAPTASNVLSLQKITVSSSGAYKVVIAIGTTGAEATKLVLFNSTAQPVQSYEFSLPQSVSDAQSVKITVINRDKSVQSIYATVEGVLMPA